MSRKRVAVFFGGRSPEHDVSIVTGLQVLEAIDATAFDAFPVYVSPSGEWFVGDLLRDRANYLPDQGTRDRLVRVSLSLGEDGRPVLMGRASKLFGKPDTVPFDIAFLAFHGLVGEDGQFQGLLETVGVPYTGMRIKASSVFMDKDTTKRFVEGLDVPTLPYATIRRPSDNSLIVRPEALANIGFPVVVKPASLGSSIGVGKAEDVDEARAVLSTLFRFDTKAILEPFVDNLVEYNVSVRNDNGTVVTSAIERPKTSAELLDFKEKYMSGGGTKSGTKQPGQGSEGMLSLTREINPKLDPDTERTMREWAAKIFTALDGSGAPRIDFIGNKKTGEIWFNELNPCPGSIGYFLWEAAPEPVRFTALLTTMLSEGMELYKRAQIPADPTPEAARLFPRR